MITVSIIADFIFTIAFIYTCKPIGWFNALWLFTFGIVVSEYKEQIILLIDKRFIPFLFIMCSAFLLTGVDEAVIHSIDFNKYPVKIVVVETVSECMDKEMQGYGLSIVKRYSENTIYVRK